MKKVDGETIKTGGRTKGTPNKVTNITKDIIANFLGEYYNGGQMEEDFKKLGPKNRLVIAEKLMQYTMPKIQSVAVDLTGENTNITIEEKLIKLAQDNDNE